jgi:cob(I)alamin adenosyltransferase
MKIYTKTGDDGSTALFGGGRVSKDAPRVSAYGAVDELNAAIGVARAWGVNRPAAAGRAAKAGPGLPGAAAARPQLADADLDALLHQIQNDLFDLGADLATPHGVRAEVKVRRLEAGDAQYLEAAIDRIETELTPLTQFVLPGGSPMAAALHSARGACRRAEREIVALDDLEPVGPGVLTFINRLSDFLFVAARAANHRTGVAEPVWTPRK